MKRQTVTRTIEVTEIRCIIESQDGRKVTRTIHIPGKHKNRLSVITTLRNKLAEGYSLNQVLYTKRNRVKCTTPLETFYSCSSHEELD